MSWYPGDHRRPTNVRPPHTGPLYAPDDIRPSGPQPAFTGAPRSPYSPTPTASTLGRMPMTPAYPVPMEAEVVSRPDFLHVMLRAALGANYLAPMTMPSYILDVGCGSGRWVRELAGEFPGARVVGLDVTPPTEINPATSGAYVQGQPRNYAFVQHDALEPLTFSPASFDLTHMRQMLGVLPVAVWPRVVGEMARVTTYGGWVELVEADLVRSGGPALETMQRWALQALLPHGLDPRVSAQLADLLRTLSLTDIRTHVVDLPIGPHGGRFGELMAADFMARVEGMRAPVLGARLATPEEFARTQGALRMEISQREYMQPFYVVCGRR